MSGLAAASVLLDTCAAIWLANADAMAASALEAILAAGSGGGVLVSPVSAWEIGMLSRRGGLQFLPNPAAWFARLLAGPGIRAAPLSPEIAIAASYLPGAPHRDPADRLLIATARMLGVPIVTRDTAIIAYAAQGFADAIVC